MKLNPNRGYANDWIDLNLDGMSSKRRVKGKTKRAMKKLTRGRVRELKESMLKEWLEERY